MEKTRTMAFQVPEETFQRLKDYLLECILPVRDESLCEDEQGGIEQCDGGMQMG